MIACSTKAKNILQNYGNQPTKSLIIFETLIRYMIEMTLNVLIVGNHSKIAYKDQKISQSVNMKTDDAARKR